MFICFLEKVERQDGLSSGVEKELYFSHPMVKLISPVLKTLVLSNIGILWHCAFCCLTLFWQTIWWKSDGFNWTSLCSLKTRVKFLWAHSHFSRTLHEDSQWTFILTKPTVTTRVMRPTSSPKSQECTKYKWNLYFQNTLHCKYSMFISLPCWDRIWEIWAYFPSLPQTAFIALNKPIYLGFKSFERRLEQLLFSYHGPIQTQKEVWLEYA